MLAHTNPETQLKDIVRSSYSQDEKLTRLLQLGCEHFGLMLGVISKINAEDYHVVSAYPNGIIQGGSDFELKDTICSVTHLSEKVISFHKASGSEWAGHPAYEKFVIESYIGMNYYKGDTPVGTINFSSPTALREKFAKEDKQMLKTFSKALSKILFKIK